MIAGSVIAGAPPRRQISDVPWPIWLFALSILVPAEMWIEVAGARIDAQRAVLIVTIPWVLNWALGAGLRRHDWLILGGALWGLAACFATLPSTAALERGGSFAIEIVVAFLLPASTLTSLQTLRAALRIFVPIIAVLSLLALLEAFLGRHFVANITAELLERPAPFVADERLGLLRARATFSHQILFGLFCAALFAPLWFEARSPLERAGRTLACATGTIVSLSSAAWVLFALQALLIGWERATRRLPHRLSLSMVLAASILVAIEGAVGGGVPGFVARYLSLNPDTAHYRELIWLHATDDIAANPLWGTAGEWSRLAWMVPSVDQLYFAKALQYGIPTIALLSIGGIAIALALLRQPMGGVRRALSTGWALSALSLAIAGLSVDFFGRSLPLAMFILGIGAALTRVDQKE